MPSVPSEHEARVDAKASLEAEFKMLYPELRRFAGAIASFDVDPDDLVQEALANVVQNGLTEIDNPAAYLRRAILNLERSHRRRGARWRERAHRAPRLPLSVDADIPLDLSLLDCLSPFDRSLLYLTVVEDLPYATVARLLGGNERTMRSRASKARKKMRAVIEKEAGR